MRDRKSATKLRGLKTYQKVWKRSWADFIGGWGDAGVERGNHSKNRANNEVCGGSGEKPRFLNIANQSGHSVS